MDLCAISLSAFCSHSLVEFAELLPTAALKIVTNTLPLRAIARWASVFFRTAYYTISVPYAASLGFSK